MLRGGSRCFWSEDRAGEIVGWVGRAGRTIVVGAEGQGGDDTRASLRSRRSDPPERGLRAAGDVTAIQSSVSDQVSASVKGTSTVLSLPPTLHYCVPPLRERNVRTKTNMTEIV